MTKRIDMRRSAATCPHVVAAYPYDYITDNNSTQTSTW